MPTWHMEWSWVPGDIIGHWTWVNKDLPPPALPRHHTQRDYILLLYKPLLFGNASYFYCIIRLFKSLWQIKPVLLSSLVLQLRNSDKVWLKQFISTLQCLGPLFWRELLAKWLKHLEPEQLVLKYLPLRWFIHSCVSPEQEKKWLGWKCWAVLMCGLSMWFRLYMDW